MKKIDRLKYVVSDNRYAYLVSLVTVSLLFVIDGAIIINVYLISLILSFIFITVVFYVLDFKNDKDDKS